MRRSLVVLMVAVLALGLGACGSDADPFAGMLDGGGGDDDGPSPGTPDAGAGTPDAGPPRKCATKPTRVVVLGDSITACDVVGGKQSNDCVSKKFADYMKAHYADGATYENYAVGGAQFSGIPSQLDAIPAGPGHILLMVYIGGNDLAPYIFMSDAAAMGAYEGIKTKLVDTWLLIYDKLGDTSKYPDGFDVIINNQYNPFDDCTASPYNLSATKINILHMYNVVVQDIANEKFQNTVLVDQFTPYLGHGHHYNVATCPHYTAGATPYMKDLIHANPVGNEALAKEIAGAADRLYRDCEP